MLISNLSVIVFVTTLVGIAAFYIWSSRSPKKRELLNRLLLWLALAYSSWVIPLLIMRVCDADNLSHMFILDCMMQPGGALCAPIYLCIAVSFTEGYDKLKSWMKWLFVLPVLTIIMAWTNPLHHLYYVEFSVIRSKIVFGPYLFISGAMNYIFLIGGILYMIRFGVKDKTALYWRQASMFIVGAVYMWEAFSVILQVMVFKATGERVFKMSPFHHHLQMSGLTEPKIVAIYSAVTAVFGVFSVIFYLL